MGRTTRRADRATDRVPGMPGGARRMSHRAVGSGVVTAIARDMLGLAFPSHAAAVRTDPRLRIARQLRV